MLEWNVFCENFNRKSIEVYNVFNHYGFLKDCIEISQKLSDDEENFKDQIKRSLMYFFWSKCEWEIILSDWPPSKKFNDKKVSVYDQIMLNWDIFIDYIWNNRLELKQLEVDA
jgi:hypothetical protein